jgi:hypothetical protein
MFFERSFRVSKATCQRRLKRYAKPFSSDGVKFNKIVEGLACKKKRCVHSSMNGLEFDPSETMIEPGFKRVRNTKRSDACKRRKKTSNGYVFV